MINNRKKNKVLHIAALVLGIISVMTGLFWYMALPTGIMAIVFGIKSYRGYGSKLGLSGFILGIVGTSITVFIYLSFIIILILQNYS